MSHPLSHHLRELPPAPNTAALVELADWIDSPVGRDDAAVRWFDHTVRLVAGRYVPCTAARRDLDGLVVGDDGAAVVARLVADELAAQAVARVGSRERTGDNTGFDRAMRQARAEIRRTTRDRMEDDQALDQHRAPSPFVRWTGNRPGPDPD